MSEWRSEWRHRSMPSSYWAANMRHIILMHSLTFILVPLLCRNSWWRKYGNTELLGQRMKLGVTVYSFSRSTVHTVRSPMKDHQRPYGADKILLGCSPTSQGMHQSNDNKPSHPERDEMRAIAEVQITVRLDLTSTNWKRGYTEEGHLYGFYNVTGVTAQGDANGNAKYPQSVPSS